MLMGMVMNTRRGRVAELFSFPNPVDEVAARLVAVGVLLMCAATVLFRQPWILAVVAYGFLARVLSGPSLSPLGQLVTRVVVPRIAIAPRPVAGPPKRFAQGMGWVISTAAVVVSLGFGYDSAGYWLAGLIIVAAALESILGLCVGCKVFAVLMRVGVVPETVCERCADIWAGRQPLA